MQVETLQEGLPAHDHKIARQAGGVGGVTKKIVNNNSASKKKNDGLPIVWEIAPFPKVVSIIPDGGKRIKKRSYLESGKIPVIDQGKEYIGGFTDDDNMTFTGELPVVLFGDHTKSIKFVKSPFAVGADGIKILKPSSCYNIKFFFYLLRSLQIPDRGYSRHFQFLKKFDLPVAPINEQSRIVAEIEKQFSHLDEAVDNLKCVKANLKRYKSFVLKAAVEGKLTEEWRKKHPHVEPADKLLQRILAERRKKWEEVELAKMKDKGKEPKDDKWKKKYKAPVGPDKQNIDNLPNDWVIVTLDQVSGINPRIDKKGIPEYLEVSFVPMPEVGAENGYINVKNTRPFAEVKKGFTNFLEGDVLFAKITPCMENGKMVVVPKLSNGYGFGSTEFHVIRPFYGVNPYFIYYLVSNLSFRKEAAHRMTGAVGQKRVPVSFLIETVMSLPPIKEQDQIIREVQRRISIIDGVDSMIEISLKHADRLRQSILKKAFSGELVPQDAGDEPVEKLLNRILSKQDKAGKKVAKKR